MKIIFWSGTKSLGLAQYVNQFLAWHKKIGPTQNVLGPVKGQGINAITFLETLKKFEPSQKNLGPVKNKTLDSGFVKNM